MSKVIKVVGSGEAFDEKFGNTSYLFEDIDDSRTVLFDCGYQIPERLWKAGDHSGIGIIFLTHLHADHAFGLVPLLVRYWEENRSKKIIIFGPPNTDKYIRSILNLGYPGLYKRFKFDIDVRSYCSGETMQFGEFRISHAQTIHTVPNYAIRIDLTKSHLSFAVSGDGQLTSDTRRLVTGVDLLLQEVYSVKPTSPYHNDLHALLKDFDHLSIHKIGIVHCSRSERNALGREVIDLQKKDKRWMILSPGDIIDMGRI